MYWLLIFTAAWSMNYGSYATLDECNSAGALAVVTQSWSAPSWSTAELNYRCIPKPAEKPHDHQ